MKFALIGAGGIGQEWSKALLGHADIQLTMVADVDLVKAQKRALEHGAVAVVDWRQVAESDIEAAIVAVPHAMLAEISQGLLQAGKHVLCEKPGGISAQEVAEVVAVAAEKKLVYMPGFNHRYHAAYTEARKIFDAGEIGDLMFVRARYGFGGRKDYEKEWRFKKAIGGGGELLDQGMHMIDMARCFLGDIEDVKGFAENMFWGGEVEDNGFALLRSKAHKVAQIHVSWTNWEWVHSFEIFGTKGYLQVEGLDTRYRGPERLTIRHADPRNGTFPTEKIVTFAEEKKEDSFRREAEDFVRAVRGETVSIPLGSDAVAALSVVEQIYAQK